MRTAFAFGCVLAIWLGFHATAYAQDVREAATIRARVRAATGARPALERVVVSFVAHGLSGRRTTYRSGEDYRELVLDGPFSMQRGERGGQAWHQNYNGETVLDQPDPGNAVADAIVTTVARTTTPVDGYRIAALNAAGSGSTEYVEARTWRVLRRDIVRPFGTTVWTYDDFRTAGGFTRPWHWTTRDGHPENDADYRVQSVAADVAASDVTIPASRGTFVVFPAETHSVELPVHADRDKFFVRMTVGERGLDFLLDTGASGITLDEDVAKSFGLTVYGRASSNENAGRYTGGRVSIPDARVGALALHDVVMNTTPHIAEERTGTYRAVGLLGFDFLAALALELDYVHGRVTATDPQDFKPPDAPHTLALDVRLSTQQPMTELTINGALGERFIVDTGASAPLLLFDYFRRRHSAALVDKGGGNFRERQYSGMGGRFDTRPYQLDSIGLGGAMFRNFVGYAVTSRTAYSGNEDGLIGTDFLRLFNVYLDYANSRVYLEPNDFGRAIHSER